jgi:hypothetical protein
MADKKISALTGATTPLAGTEVLPIVQAGSTVKVASDDLTVKNIRANATTGILQVTGPAAASTRVVTVPDANFTAARTDAGQTFTGTQAFTTVLSGLTTSAGLGANIQGKAGAGGTALETFDSAGNQLCAFRDNGFAYIPPIYNKTSASVANVFVGSSGDLYRSISALKYKTDIRDLENIDISALRPVRYKSKCEGDDPTEDYIGFIADEADDAGLKDLVVYGDDGQVEGFKYDKLPILLLAEIRKLESRIKILEGK